MPTNRHDVRRFFRLPAAAALTARVPETGAWPKGSPGRAPAAAARRRCPGRAHPESSASPQAEGKAPRRGWPLTPRVGRRDDHSVPRPGRCNPAPGAD